MAEKFNNKNAKIYLLKKKIVFSKKAKVQSLSYGQKEQPCQIAFPNSFSIRAQKREAEMVRLFLEPARILLFIISHLCWSYINKNGTVVGRFSRFYLFIRRVA